MSTFLDRLMKVIDNNPSFKRELQKEFPELKSNEPFIYQDTIFFRKACLHHIYVLRFKLQENCKNGGYFYVHNITNNADWTQTKESSGVDYKHHPFLTETDFYELLRYSGIGSIAIVDKEFIVATAESAFKAQKFC